MTKKMTWPEREFKKLLTELKIEHEMQKIVGFKIYDFFIPEINTLFEVDGDYWHGKDVVYEDKSPMQKRSEKNDKYKDRLALALGYKIERVWESDLKEDYVGVKGRILNLCDIYKR